MPDDLRLYIGSKAFSSWSLRPWLAMKRAGLAFEEVVIPLRQETTKSAIRKVSPSGKVPCLEHGPMVIWDSLAICEYAAELASGTPLWPADQRARALARAVSAEMHAGFATLRQTLPMDFPRRLPAPEVGAELSADIARIVSMWRETRRQFGAIGPFLFGGFSIADAMYAPVASRFTTYGIGLQGFGDDGTAESYRQHMMALPEMMDWERAAGREIS
jgi:glutathione S-transferase